jgi:hypothetical protein
MTSTSSSVSTSDPYAGKTTWTFMRHGEGLAAGLIGAVTIAVWFFILDAVKGRPFYTPSVLGTVVFKGLTSSEALQQPGISFEMVLAFTWFHVLVFCALGWIAGWFVQRAEESPHFGYGIALLIVFLLCGFIVACLIFAEPVLHALTMPAILVGNVLAVLAMGIFFWRRHPRLKMLP